jgi:hypothetical protein
VRAPSAATRASKRCSRATIDSHRFASSSATPLSAALTIERLAGRLAILGVHVEGDLLEVDTRRDWNSSRSAICPRSSR